MFAVPRPIKRQVPTGADEIRLDELPTDLRERMDNPDEVNTKPDIKIPQTVQKRRLIRRRRKSMTDVRRKAFDLDEKDAPKRRTGVGVINVSDLPVDREGTKP